MNIEILIPAGTSCPVDQFKKNIEIRASFLVKKAFKATLSSQSFSKSTLFCIGFCMERLAALLVRPLYFSADLFFQH